MVQKVPTVCPALRRKPGNSCTGGTPVLSERQVHNPVLKNQRPRGCSGGADKMFWNVGDQALWGIYTLVWSRQKMHHSLGSDTWTVEWVLAELPGSLGIRLPCGRPLSQSRLMTSLYQKRQLLLSSYKAALDKHQPLLAPSLWPHLRPLEAVAGFSPIKLVATQQGQCLVAGSCFSINLPRGLPKLQILSFHLPKSWLIMPLVKPWIMSLFTEQLGDSNSGVLHLKKKKHWLKDQLTQHSNFFLLSHFRVKFTAENEVTPYLSGFLFFFFPFYGEDFCGVKMKINTGLSSLVRSFYRPTDFHFPPSRAQIL